MTAFNSAPGNWIPSLPARRKIAAWTAAGSAAVSFLFIAATRDAALALQFSACLGALTILCLRWWTAPVHPGAFSWFSPHALIMLHGLIYFGHGNLAALAFPDRILINWSQDDYLHALLQALAALLVFDLCYRWAVGRLGLNALVETRLKQFHSRRLQRLIPFLGTVWYLLCAAAFLYLSRRYVMQTFTFVGADREAENILVRSGQELITVAWAFISLGFFRVKKSWRLLLLAAGGALVPVIIGYDNLRLAAHLLLLTLFCAVIYRRRHPGPRALALLAAGFATIFVFSSSYKIVRRHDPFMERYTSEETNLWRRFRLFLDSPRFLDPYRMELVFKRTFQTRMAGLDYWAAMIDSRRQYNTPFARGGHALNAASIAIPRLLWRGKGRTAAGVEENFLPRHFDQVVTPFSSLYPDGGVAAVIIGSAALAIFLAAVQKFIFHRWDGILIYLGSFRLILAFEGSLARNYLLWLRWVLILAAINSLLAFVYRRVLTYRRNEETEETVDTGLVPHLSAGIPGRGADSQHL